MLNEMNKYVSMISDDPDRYYTHFIQLSKRDSKGKAVYQCRTCGHKFHCSGKVRHIQHIVGKELTISNTRNIIPCSNPHLPLREKLISVYSAREKIPVEPKIKIPKIKLEPKVKVEPERTVAVETEVEAITKVVTTANVNASDNNSVATTADIYSIEEDPDFSEILMSFLPEEPFMPSSYSSPKSDRSSTDFFVDSPRICGDGFVPPSPMEVELNRKILNFFSTYHIPLEAVDDPVFLDLCNEVQVGSTCPSEIVQAMMTPIASTTTLPAADTRPSSLNTLF